MAILGEDKYKKYLIIKNDIINFIIKELFYNLTEYFNNGDIVYVGSLIYKQLNINKKNYIKDIDISINIDDHIVILDKINKTLNNIDLNYYINKLQNINYNNKKNNISKNLIKKRKDKYSYFLIDGVVGIDIFINDHNKENANILYINNDIYTYFFGYKWVLETTYNLYLFLKENDPNNCDKIIKTMKMVNKFNVKNHIYEKINSL